MKYQANKHRRELQFEKGDWVLVKFQPYRQESMANRLNFKLSKGYFGPFQVEDKIGQVAYKLTMPAESKIHPVFQVSLLKAYKIEPHNPRRRDLPPDTFNCPQPEQVGKQDRF